MSLEAYATHIAPRGGKIDLIVDQIDAERQAAQEARMAYARSKGATGVYAGEYSVAGLVFPYDDETEQSAKLPDGWRQMIRTEGGVVAEPKSKDRTKESRALTKQLKAELAALPRLVGADAFTSRIGGNQVIGAPAAGIRGFALRSCTFERVGDTTFVFTPWSTKREETGNLDEDNEVKTAFLPEGCERVGLSRYYAAKEKLEAAT